MIRSTLYPTKYRTTLDGTKASCRLISQPMHNLRSGSKAVARDKAPKKHRSRTSVIHHSHIFLDVLQVKLTAIFPGYGKEIFCARAEIKDKRSASYSKMYSTVLLVPSAPRASGAEYKAYKDPSNIHCLAICVLPGATNPREHPQPPNSRARSSSGSSPVPPNTTLTASPLTRPRMGLQTTPKVPNLMTKLFARLYTEC